MKKTIDILGIASILTGVAATVLCFLPGRSIFYSMMCGLAGFFITTIYIGLNTRHQVNKNKITPGTYGLILNSIPVFFVLANLVIAHYKGK